MTGARSAAPAREPLRRAAGDRLLLGVCAGLARSFDLSPLAVRLAVVALAAIAAPLVLAAYVVAAAIVPRDDGRALLGGVPADRRETLLGWTLVAIVLTAFASAEFRLEDLVWPRLSSFGIFAAAAAALGLIAASQRRAAMSAATQEAPATPPAPASPAAASAPESADSSTADSPGADEPAPEAADADPAEAATVAFADSEPPTATQPLPAPTTPPAPRGLSLGVIAAAALLIGGALVFLLDAVGAIDPSAAEVAGGLAVAAAVAGAGAIAGAVTGRRGVIVLLALGAVLGASAAGVALLSTELDDGVGFRTVRPASASEIPETYRLGAGELEIDLRETDLPAGVTTVRALIGAGSLTVLVPRGVRVESVGATDVAGVLTVNGALPERPAGKRKAARKRPATPRTTIRIDADIREGDADVVRGGP